MTDSTARHPQDKICAYEYTVRRGDSFYLIAHRLGVPLRDLLEANSNINPARLMVGDVLCIPMEEDDRPPESQVPSTPTQPEEVPEAEPETQPEGETPAEPEEVLPDMMDGMDDLDQPAQPGGETIDNNFAVCPESMRHTVQEGETVADIQLEADVTLHTLQTANPNADLDNLVPGQVLCVPDENIPCERLSTMTLHSGDTLESIALQLNTSVGALLRANPCLAPGDFTSGVCINIPRS